MGDQRLDSGVNSRIVDGVKIVQHQEEVGRQRYQVVDEGGNQRIDWRRGRCGERTLNVLADRRVDLLQGGDEVTEETRGIVVPLIEREPRHGVWQPPHPRADQGGFAKTGRR